MHIAFLLDRSRIALIAGSLAVLTLIGYETVHSLAGNTPVTPPRLSPLQPVASTPAASKAQIKAARKPLRKRLPSLPSLAGLASWYGSVLDGHKTASGEVFDEDKMTACHRTLPFGTLVRVVALTTGKSVVVKINDRGTLAEDRVIDLSAGAARELGILRAGVAKVKLEVLKGDQVAFAGRPVVPAF